MRLTKSSLCRNRAHGAAVVLLALLAGIAAAACTPAPRGWVDPPKANALAWKDDGDPYSLLAAIDQSRVYLQRLRPDAKFQYGETVYTAEELNRSLALFTKLVQSDLDPPAFRAELLRLFDIHESRAETGENLFTGYYEPIIAGSDTPTGTLTTPVYTRPLDLVEIPLERFDKTLPARKLMGRVENGTVVPYYSRGDIQSRDPVKNVARRIVYVNDVDLFFLQIQGSGRVQLPDGRILRVGYDGSNGHPYRSLGAEMIRRELLQREEVTLQSIKAYLALHPDAVTTLLNTNPSYIFFRELDGTAGPLGNLGVPLTPGRSLAADQRKVPAAAIAFVETEVPVFGDTKATEPLRRFMMVQDIGGAIRGHGRGDIFWGTGALAEWRAGHSKQNGRLLVLVAKKDFLGPLLNTADTK